MDPSDLALGIDVGGTAIKAGAISGGRVLRRVETATPHELQAFLDALAGLARELAGGTALPPVGVGIPGFPAPADGSILGAPNLPFLQGVPLGPALEERLGVPVRVDNDANLAAWGEALRGAGRGRPDFLLATIGTGIGGGLVLDGRLYRGPGGLAGEFGHLPVGHDRLCGCGARGCLEAAVSARSLAAWAREEGLEATDLRELAALARAGNGGARDLLRRAGALLGEALAQVALLLDLRVFVIGGGGAPVLDLLREPALQVLVLRAFGREREDFELLQAELGNDAGFFGAAALALEAGARA